MKGQGSTEYIVMLAVVMVIVLITAALLGFFPSFAGDTQATQSDAYWGSTKPVAITNALVQSPVGVNVTIENHGSKEITITGASFALLNGTMVNNSTSTTISPGSKAYMIMPNASNTMTTMCTNKAGSRVSFNVNFTYTDSDLAGRVQVGSKPLAVLCQ